MSLADFAAQHGLKRVGARSPLGEYAKQVWQRRDFAYTLARSRIRAQNQANRFGMAWVVITPLLDAAVYGIVFGFVLGANKPDNFLQYLITGIFFFRFFSGCLSDGTKSITNNQNLVQSLSFPRMVLPLATAIEHLLNFMPMVALMIVINVLFGSVPSWSWFYLIPAVVMAAVFNAGLVMFVARVTVHFRDLSQVIPFVNRFARYFSGVLYGPERFIPSVIPAGFIFFFTLNPLYDYMQIARGALVPGYDVDMTTLLVGAAWAIVSFVGGGLYFWAAEERYGRTD